MQKSNFKEWNLDKIDDTFELRQVRRLPILEELLAFERYAAAIQTTDRPQRWPRGQALIAMLVAQQLNDNKNRNADRPIFGSYIIGRDRGGRPLVFYGIGW